MPVGILRAVSAVVAAAVVAGCGGGIRSVTPPSPQSPGSTMTASVMNSLYPKSASPASFKVAAMPQTTILPASAMGNITSAILPKAINGTSWTQLSGDSSQVAIAPDGSIWALSDQPIGSANKNIWHYVNGTWTNISGVGSSIAVGPTGTVYVVNATTRAIDEYNGSTWTSLGGARERWRQPTTARFTLSPTRS